jgi:hypothetical protein
VVFQFILSLLPIFLAHGKQQTTAVSPVVSPQNKQSIGYVEADTFSILVDWLKTGSLAQLDYFPLLHRHIYSSYPYTNSLLVSFVGHALTTLAK